MFASAVGQPSRLFLKAKRGARKSDGRQILGDLILQSVPEEARGPVAKKPQLKRSLQDAQALAGRKKKKEQAAIAAAKAREPKDAFDPGFVNPFPPPDDYPTEEELLAIGRCTRMARDDRLRLDIVGPTPSMD